MHDAKRLREAANTVDDAAGIVDESYRFVEVEYKAWDAARALAQHYLATTRDDDEEVVTEEWLRSVGAKDGTGCWIWPEKDGEQCYPLLLLEHVGDCWSAVICGDEWPNDIRTRGEVVRLLSALGIELPKREVNSNG